MQDLTPTVRDPDGATVPTAGFAASASAQTARKPAKACRWPMVLGASRQAQRLRARRSPGAVQVLRHRQHYVGVAVG